MAEENESIQPKLKELDLNKSTFMANGNKYTILKGIPLSRYKIYKKLFPRLIYGLDTKTLFQNCKKGFDYCNKPIPEPANAGIIFYNIMNGIKDVDDDNREDPALLICSLIIAKEGEDIGIYSEALAIEKIKDWAAEGYGPSGFFHLALLSIEGFKETFSEYIESHNAMLKV